MTGKAMVILLSSTVNNALISPTPSIQSEAPFKTSQADNIFQLIGLIFALVLILVAAYYTSKYLGKLSVGKLKNSNFKVIDTYRVNQNKFVQIVKIGNKFVVLGVGKDTINLITELDESEVITRDVQMKENMSFKQIFDKIRSKPE